MKYEIGTKVFGDWEIVAELGEGSFGKVFRLEKNTYKVKASSALKVLTVPRSASEVKDALAEGYDEQSVTEQFHEIVEKLVDEIAVMAELKSHPHIVSVEDYTVIEHEGTIGWDILIRMELLTSLQDHQRMNPMDEAAVRQLAMDICEALVFCQEKKLIHRDIKPGNVFVDSLGQYKLGDFGVARTAEKTMSGMSKQGTENYMAPEVYFGREYGPNVDIYSLGMMLYRLMNKNRLPFYPLPPAFPKFKEKEQALIRRLKGEALPPPCDASSDFAQIILKACEANPGKRYHTAAEMLKDLSRENEKELDGDDISFENEDDEEIHVGNEYDVVDEDEGSFDKTDVTVSVYSRQGNAKPRGDKSKNNGADEKNKAIQGRLDQYLLNDDHDLSGQNEMWGEDSTDRMRDHSVVVSLDEEEYEDATVGVFRPINSTRTSDSKQREVRKEEKKPVLKNYEIQSEEKKPIGGTDLAELNLSVRTYNVLKRAEIHTIEELCAMTRADLRDINNLGPATLEDIQVCLAAQGYKLSAGKSQKQLWRENKTPWMLEYWKKNLPRIYGEGAKLPDGRRLTRLEQYQIYFRPDIPALICSDAIYHITEHRIQRFGSTLTVTDAKTKAVRRDDVLGILDLSAVNEKPCTHGVVVTADAIYLHLGGSGKEAAKPMVIPYEDFSSGWTHEAGGLLKSKRTVLYWKSRQDHKVCQYESSMSDLLKYDILLECLRELSKKHR